MQFVPRVLEPVLRRTARDFPAVIVTGPRRAGKTTLLRKAFPRAGYALLEDPDVLSANVSTQFLEAWRYEATPPSDDAVELALVAAAFAATHESLGERGASQPKPPSAWRTARPTYGHRA